MPIKEKERSASEIKYKQNFIASHLSTNIPYENSEQTEQSITVDEALTPEIENDFNRSRNQFETRQELVKSPEQLTPEFVNGQKIQLLSQLKEHALAQPYIVTDKITFKEDGIHYAGQKTTKPFIEELICTEDPLNIFAKLKPYFWLRFGHNFSNEELIYHAKDPDKFRQIVSDQVFYTTKLGLEFAEVIGLIKLENLLKNLQDGQMAVEFSPGSKELRPTPVTHNWIRIYQKEVDDQGNPVIKATYVKTFDKFQTFRRKYQLFDTSDRDLSYVQDIVNSPVVTSDSLEGFLNKVGVETNPEYLKLYDKVLNDKLVIAEVEAIVEGMNTGWEISQIDSRIRRLQSWAIKYHKHLTKDFLENNTVSQAFRRMIGFFQSFYGKGGGCGLESLLVGSPVDNTIDADDDQVEGDPKRPHRWKCKNCNKIHCIDENDPKTFYEHCVRCGASGRC